MTQSFAWLFSIQQYSSDSVYLANPGHLLSADPKSFNPFSTWMSTYIPKITMTHPILIVNTLHFALLYSYCRYW